MTGTKKQSQSRVDWPLVIDIKSDGSQIAFVCEKPPHKNDKEPFAMYEYTRARMGTGRQFPLSQSQVMKMVERNA